MSKTLEMDTLRRWLAEGRPVTVLDVRPEQERTEWSIPGSLHRDAYARLRAGDEAALAGLELPRDRPVVTVCAAGNTSRIAAEQLARHGYDAASLAGGMKAWSLAWNTAELTLPGGVRVVQVRRTGKGCLSYLVASGGQALALDPALDPQVYRDLARDLGVEIVAVLETHVHADHLSRAEALARTLSVPRYLPAQERVACDFLPLRDGDELAFGSSRLGVLHTPGHTWESSSFTLEGAVFTGDTLFTDSVGRPDLEAAPGEVRRRAAALHASLERLLEQPEETRVLPGHASAPLAFDGRPWAARLGEIRASVELLGLGRDAFVAYLVSHTSEAPANHQRIVQLNEACNLPHDTSDLEAGANRCAVH